MQDQNDSFERKIKNIIDIDLAFLAHASLPRKFWGEALVSTLKIINALPAKIMNGIYPFPKLFNHKLNYTFSKLLVMCVTLLYLHIIGSNLLTDPAC